MKRVEKANTIPTLLSRKIREMVLVANLTLEKWDLHEDYMQVSQSEDLLSILAPVGDGLRPALTVYGEGDEDKRIVLVMCPELGSTYTQSRDSNAPVPERAAFIDGIREFLADRVFRLALKRHAEVPRIKT